MTPELKIHLLSEAKILSLGINNLKKQINQEYDSHIRQINNLAEIASALKESIDAVAAKQPEVLFDTPRI